MLAAMIAVSVRDWKNEIKICTNESFRIARKKKKTKKKQPSYAICNDILRRHGTWIGRSRAGDVSLLFHVCFVYVVVAYYACAVDTAITEWIL